jgi:S-formylglutathione hydrolase FrmB
MGCLASRSLSRVPVVTSAITSLLLAFGCTRKPTPLLDKPRLTPNVVMHDITLHSSSLNRDMQYRVVLAKNTEPARKLPVVYLLHGGGADFRSWTNDSDVARFAEKGFVLVMPEGNSSYYVNAAERAEDRFEDYIVQDLISDSESKLPIAHGRQNRAIVGVSMGGFGAINLSLKHPDLFGFAAALSPAIDVPSRPFSLKRIGQWRQHSTIFGPWRSSTRTGNDPYLSASKADSSYVPFLYISCGKQEGLLPANRRFASLLASHHFHFEFHAVSGGHDWNQWNAQLSDIFQSLAEHLKRPD